jgi:hypothetical protein
MKTGKSRLTRKYTIYLLHLTMFYRNKDEGLLGQGKPLLNWKLPATATGRGCTVTAVEVKHLVDFMLCIQSKAILSVWPIG